MLAGEANLAGFSSFWQHLSLMWTETRYHPDRDQTELAGAIGGSLASILPLSRLHMSREETAENWTALRDLGLFEIAVAEEQGGSGLGAVEETLIALELGCRVAAPSVLMTLGMANVEGGAAQLPAASARRVAAGHRRGDRIIFVHDPDANLLLVRSESSAVLYEFPASSAVVDDLLWSCGLHEARELGEPLAECDTIQLLRLRLIEAAALAGLAQAALTMAVGYAEMREQFGRPIGSFQAIKHHCANMVLAARCARDQVSFAAVALDDGREDAALQVESAFFVAGTAARENAGKNIQIHGGIGFSDEASPHHILKRAQMLVALGGGLEAAITRLGDLELGCKPWRV